MWGGNGDGTWGGTRGCTRGSTRVGTRVVEGSSPLPLPHVSILANINVSLLANSKVDMVNVFEGGGGEEVERYCVIIIFSIHFFYFFRFSTFQKFYLAIKLTKV